MIAAIEAAVHHDIAGDPITGIRWTRRTTEKISQQLATLDIQVGPRTVARILKDLDYRLRVNQKRVAHGSGPDRDQQFTYIAEQRIKFAERDLPIVSIDSKKRELVGNFKNPGSSWGRAPHLVNDHDFRSQADGIAIPYGGLVAGTVFLARHGQTVRGRRRAWSPRRSGSRWRCRAAVGAKRQGRSLPPPCHGGNILDIVALSSGVSSLPPRPPGSRFEPRCLMICPLRRTGNRAFAPRSPTSTEGNVIN